MIQSRSLSLDRCPPTLQSTSPGGPLRGHSSESIGFNLGISLGTVKTHRKNAYAKLGVTSQSELLSVFLEAFRSA